MALTPEQFLTKAAPAFDSICEEDVQDALNEAACLMNVANWGCKYDQGQFYLTAHILTELSTLKTGGATGGVNAIPSGPVLSEKIKSWSATYGRNGAFDADAYATTSWGRAYIARRNLVFSNRCF